MIKKKNIELNDDKDSYFDKNILRHNYIIYSYYASFKFPSNNKIPLYNLSTKKIIIIQVDFAHCPWGKVPLEMWQSFRFQKETSPCEGCAKGLWPKINNKFLIILKW